jgi:dihydroorotate dehydrogenase electron transfer subunit
MKHIMMGDILQNREFVSGIYEMVVYAPAIAEEARSGQFVNLYTGKGEMILPRPISICEKDTKKGTLRFLYQAVGKGTVHFSTLNVGEKIRILGPLGNGFQVGSGTNNVVIGGGIGVPPLLELVKQLKGSVQVFIGAKTTPILEQEFRDLGAEVFVATEDGSYGFSGNVMEVIKKVNPNPDAVFACGPRGLLRAISQWSEEKAVEAQVSMEERMACGIGACVGCTVKIQKKGATDWENLKVCKDGPVFLSSEVIWDE